MIKPPGFDLWSGQNLMLATKRKSANTAISERLTVYHDLSCAVFRVDPCPCRACCIGDLTAARRGGWLFQLEVSPTVGSIETSDYEKRIYAHHSLQYNINDATFCELFPDDVQVRPAAATGTCQLLIRIHRS